jgi:hypothetical protein
LGTADGQLDAAEDASRSTQDHEGSPAGDRSGAARRPSDLGRDVDRVAGGGPEELDLAAEVLARI